MARGKKWTIPFESLNGTACVVDIYEEGYSGTVTELSTENANAPGVPSAVPFEIQEDDSNDLTHFIRYKTGSLRLKEMVYGGLTDLMPRNILDHYIEAYYGSELVFTGFMQCQEFDNDWVATPREMEFPVISPLGLLDAYKFQVPSEPDLVTLGSLMYEVITGLNGGYTDVVYPVSTGYSPWNNVMSSTVLVPLNDSFKHYDSNSDLYEPRDYKYFVEGICACFGWMVHDTPTSIEFTKYNYDGNYSRLTLAGLLSLNSGWSAVQQLATAFNSYYTNTDNNAMQSVVMPAKEVNLSLEGANIKDKQMGTVYAVTHGLMGGTAVSREVSLTQIGPDVDGANIGTAVFDTGGEIAGNGLFPVAYGKVEANAVTVSMQESWVIRYLSSWGETSPMLIARFFGQMPKNSAGYSLLKLKMEWGTSLQDMKATNYNDFNLNLVIKSGSEYYDLANDMWSSYLTYNPIIIDGNKGKVTPNKAFPTGPSIGIYENMGDIDGLLFTMPYGIDAPLEVSLYKSSLTSLADNDYLRITELSVTNPGSIDEPYNSYYRDRDHIRVGGNATGTDSKDITVNFNNYASSRGEHTFGDRNIGADGGNPTFPYLFVPMTVLTEKVKRIDTPAFDEYAAKWTYWINGWRWRMIAQSFNMVDDEYQIILARSSSIE